MEDISNEKKLGLILFIFFILWQPLFGDEDENKIYFSTSVQPYTFWGPYFFLSLMGYGPFFSGSDVSWEYLPSTITSYEINLKHRSGFSFGSIVGVNIDYEKDDNIVGRIANIMGIIGYKNLNLRVEQGNIPMIVKYDVTNFLDLSNWIYIDTSKTYKTNGKYYNVELLYQFIPGLGAGIGYTYLSIPLPSDLNIETIFNSSLNDYNTINIMGYIDTFRMHLQDFSYDIFNLWLEYRAAFGIGLNMITIRSDLTVGFFLAFNVGNGSCGIGIGYNYTGETFLQHHGPVIRAAFSW